MDEKLKSPHIGKYVCYDQMDGGACWGRIKDEARVNTMKGEKEVFILTDRWVRYPATVDKRRFRAFYPAASTSPARQVMVQGQNGTAVPAPGEVFLEIHKVYGDSTLRKESINLETDIIDVEELIKRVGFQETVATVTQSGDPGITDKLVERVGIEVVFRAVLEGRATGILESKSAAEIGLKVLMQDESFRKSIMEKLSAMASKKPENVP